MKKLIILCLTVFTLSQCTSESVDVIVINSNTYTVNENFDTAQAFAVKDGKFVAVGSNEEIQSKFTATNTIDNLNLGNPRLGRAHARGVHHIGRL